MDKHERKRARIFLAVSILILVGLVSAAAPKGEAKEAAAAADAPKEAPKEEKVDKNDPASLSKTSLGEVVKWDEKACGQRLKDINKRMRDLQKEKFGLYRKEAEAKNLARKRNELPPQCRKLAEEIAQLKRDLDRKSRLLSQHMNGMEAVKDVRKEHDKLDKEWQRLVILKDAINRHVKALETKKEKGAAETQNAG